MARPSCILIWMTARKGHRSQEVGKCVKNAYFDTISESTSVFVICSIKCGTKVADDGAFLCIQIDCPLAMVKES